MAVRTLPLAQVSWFLFVLDGEVVHKNGLEHGLPFMAVADNFHVGGPRQRELVLRTHLPVGRLDVLDANGRVWWT